MKYVALLSGGKDSCYNLLHCQSNNHELVAAASLRPEQGKEELDSYLYQTVGQDAIEFVARALDVPLYRGTITGSAVEQGPEYGTRISRKGVDGDETEDLYNLLANVKSRHPDIQGVSVGAILSNYQRVRVEHVCQRLSLTCLCYLWQRRQDELLSEMIEAGMEAVLIKVAGIGLTTKHLGKTLREMQPTLTKLNDLYGSHICGEGGEYESLTLDCPLFKFRIILTDVETVIHSDHDFAVVAYLRIKNARLEPRSGSYPVQLRIPPLLDETYEAVRSLATEAEPSSSNAAISSQSVHNTHVFAPGLRKRGKWVAVTNVQAKCFADESIENEITKCFHILQDRLASLNLSLAHSTNINLFLASMDDFARANAVYGSFFGTSPPSRACVALDLPPGIRVRIDCLAYAETGSSTNAERQALHVQSQSYWAPANIGPYSQAVLVDERLFISGQIGLIPSSISLPSPCSLATEIALSIQHADRIVEVLRNGWEGFTQMAIYWLSDASHADAVRNAIKAYDGDKVSVKLLIAVKTLPKGALVEKQVMAHTGRAWVEDDDVYGDNEQQEMVLKTVLPFFQQGDITTGNLFLHWETSRSQDALDSASCTLLCFRSGSMECTTEDVALLRTQLKQIRAVQSCFNDPLSIRYFHLNNDEEKWPDSLILDLLYECFAVKKDSLPITSIPSRFIATQSDVWLAALLIMH
ncbi:hypothetical protein EV361DRAFT_989549 [Lentinula raphanica]|nr:hypothetical protein EV361DRAFT_989549 [Lentinula raphanica]